MKTTMRQLITRAALVALSLLQVACVPGCNNKVGDPISVYPLYPVGPSQMLLPPILSAVSGTVFLYKDESMAFILPYNSGGAIATCTATPVLPAGLTLESTTCRITGTPAAIQASTAYTLKAVNAAGSSSINVNVKVIRKLLGILDTDFNGTGLQDGISAGIATYKQGLSVMSDDSILSSAIQTNTQAFHRFTATGGDDLVTPMSDLASDCNTLFGVTCSPGATLRLSNGKILVSYLVIDTPQRLKIARHNPDGTLDAGFGTGGVVSVNSAAATQESYRLAEQADGKVLLIANFADPRPSGFVPAVVRILGNGTLDASFGTGGVAKVYEVNNVYAMALDPVSGRIYLGAKNSGVSTWREFIVALLPDGTVDDGYGVNGVSDLDSWSGNFLDLAVDPFSGRLVIAVNNGGNPNDPLTVKMKLRRLLANGDDDLTFGVNGVRQLTIHSAASYESYVSTRVKIDQEGKILLLGKLSQDVPGDEPTSRFVLSRFTLAGSLDTDFGDDGHLEGPTGVRHDLSSIEFTGDKRVVLGGLKILVSAGPAYSVTGYQYAVVMVK